MKLDNTAVTAFQTCHRKFMLRHIQGWAPRSTSPALAFGGAMHLGLGEWYRSHDLDKARSAIIEGWPEGIPPDDYRTLDKALRVMGEYAGRYPSEPWEVVQGATGPLIEISFVMPLGWLDCDMVQYVANLQDGTTKVNAECGGHPNAEGKCDRCGKDCEPLEYGGIIDGVIRHSNALYVLEHKTTSQLGPLYFRQFRPNSQVTGYLWGGAQLSGQVIAGAYVNAIGVYKTGATKFERHPSSRMPAEIEEWKRNIIITANEIARCKRTGEWPMSPHSCTMYNGCEFHEVDELPLPQDRQRLLEQKYKIEHWDFEHLDR